MLICKWIRRTALLLSTAGILIPTQCFHRAAQADEQLLTQQPAITSLPTPAASVRPVDISLDAGNILHGAVVDNAGQPAAFASVLLLRQQQLVAIGQADEQGRFAISNVRGGLYQIASGDQMSLLRCWTDGTAPPTAKSQTLLQVSDVQRAQISPATCSLMNPWIIAGVTIAAIAIPIAIHANRDDRDDGS